MSLTYSYKVPSVGKSKIYKSHSASYTEEIDAPHGISEPILPPFQKTVDQSSGKVLQTLTTQIAILF